MADYDADISESLTLVDTDSSLGVFVESCLENVTLTDTKSTQSDMVTAQVDSLSLLDFQTWKKDRREMFSLSPDIGLML